MTLLNDPASVFSPERVPTVDGDRLGLGDCRVRAMDTIWIPVTENARIAHMEML